MAERDRRLHRVPERMPIVAPSMNPARAALNAAMTEREFREWVVDLARLRGWRVYWTWNSIHSPKGMLDLIMLRRRDRRLIFAELKTEKGKVTEDQQAWIDDLQFIAILALGVSDRSVPEVYLWRPSDAPEIERILA